MDETTLARFRMRLQRRRRDLVRNREVSERGAQEVRDGRTDPEYEESAQADHLEFTLHQISDARAREVGLIDAALARLDAGTYDACLECRDSIEGGRLEALPYAVLCAECAVRDDERLAPTRQLPTL